MLSDEDNKVILGCGKTHPLSNTLFMKTELLSTTRMVVRRVAGELSRES